jgi:hypothetical protein
MRGFKHILRIVAIAIILAIATLAIPAQMASANTPSVTLSTSLNASHYILNISVTHSPPPALSTSHYVDKVEITMTNSSGTKTIDLTTAGSTLPAAPQSVAFYANYDMGALSLNTSISVRAQDVIHGWSSSATAKAGPAATGGGGTTPASPDNTMLIAGIVVIAVVLIVVVAIVMKRKGGKEKPKE